jgi:hypothetical protein
VGQQADPEDGIPAIPNGTDITGRGRPDIIVRFYTGGAHCCTLHFLFELQPQFRLVATLDSDDDGIAHFGKLNGDSTYYYFSTDWTFAYWPQSFAGSPSASVILRFQNDPQGGSYRLALDKMRKPAPRKADWNKSLAEARDKFSDNVWDFTTGGTLWNTVLNLLYDGHADLAWRFLDEAWPRKMKGKQRWLNDFCSRLKTSPYWPDLAPTLRNAPAACKVR